MMNRSMTHVEKAFTLVELSIVLVILGLLAGGVLSGQSLIRAAELRTVTTDYSRYTAAVMSFRDKYFALPGDMPNATQFWGSAGGTGADTARVSNGVYDIVYESTSAALYASATRQEVNSISLYGYNSTGVLKPEEAWNVDTKLDDGSPVSGRMFANKKTSTVGGNCASSDANNATYDFTQTSRNCTPHIAL